MKSCSASVVFCLAAAFGGLSVALAESQIITDRAPPAPRVEIAPPTRSGYVWSPGHWEWSGHTYFWVPGTWVVERRGAHYVAAQWQVQGTQWRFVRGHWER